MNLPPDLRLTPKIAATIRNATAINHSEGNRIATTWESITAKVDFAEGYGVLIHSEGRRLIQISCLKGLLFTTPGKGVNHAEECGFVPFTKASPNFRNFKHPAWEELIVEIFTRLSSKSLIRFRSLSKSLYSCISSPGFIRLHTFRSPQKVLSIHYYSKKEAVYTLHGEDWLSLSPKDGYIGITTITCPLSSLLKNVFICDHR
ncbi:hypothetical protein LXL04_037693 [Taraxacum kok-saghyz]